MTAAVVAVYLGLVLAGATPQLVAQTPQQHSIQRRSEVREFEPAVTERSTSNDPSGSTNGLAAADGSERLDLSQAEASLHLSLVFAAAEVAQTHTSTIAVIADEALDASVSSLGERIHRAGLDAISSTAFARSVPLARSGLLA